MRDPRKKKLRDLRRKLKSCQRPHAWKLFALYVPEWSDHNPHTGQLDWKKWDIPGFYEESQKQESIWLYCICGYEPYWDGSPPAWYRRMHNRLRRARQKEAFRQACRDGDLDDFSVNPEHRSIRWDWW